MDANEVLKALDQMHPPDKSAGFAELRIGTGFGKDALQRLDYWAIFYGKSKQFKSVAYEIKVSKQDFNHEINKPKKRRAALRLSNEYYFVVPKGLVTITEVPPECGLLEVDESGKIHRTISAPYRNIIPYTNNFVSAICRRLDKPRLSVYNDILSEDGKLKAYGETSLNVIQDHIKKWKGFNKGSKEIPDQIASAMESLYNDVIQAIEDNQKIK